MKIRLLAILCCALALSAAAQTPEKLTGEVIGTARSVDYNTGTSSTTVNTVKNAFDGRFDTFFASYERSFTWVGLDLGTPHIITRVGLAARVDGLGPGRTQLAVFQGANNPDFSDAMPIYLVPSSCPYNSMTYADVECSRGFRYVRYVGPRDARCNIAELEFYGYEGEGDDSALYQVTNLPTVVVNTPNMEWFHENNKNYEFNGSTIIIIADRKIDTNAPGQIRGRGNASWGFPKKPFRIKFESKQRVLCSPAKAKKWTMINNYGDKTLMRNRLAFDISEKVGLSYTPACHFVDLVFNGEYQGTYQLCDQIEVNKDRVNITEMEPEDISGEALTGGYLVEIDAYAYQEAADEYFYTNKGYSLPVTIKSPDPGVTQQYNYIRDRMSELSYRVKSSFYTDETRGYRAMLDLDSFLKHFIVGELSGNTDTYWSVYMTLDRGDDHFYTGPCWDFDLAFENDNRTYPINNKTDFIYRFGSAAGDMQSFVTRIVKNDKNAKNQLTYLWSYAREVQGLDAETFEALIDEYAAQLAQSQELNFKRWPILNQYVHQNPKIYGSYEGEVNNVKNYIRQRFIKLDALIGRCEVSSVEDVAMPQEVNGSAAVYNLQGVYVGDSLDTLPHGCYIVRHADGSTQKILK